MSIVVAGVRMLYEVRCSSRNKELYVTVQSSSPFHLSHHSVHKVLLNYTYNSSPYFAGNTLRLRYEAQRVNAV
jgi:hypothetical protein